MPSMTCKSARMKRLLREIESRRQDLAHTGRVTKKVASPPHHSSSPPTTSSAAVDERSTVLALPTPIKEGAMVSVRTRVSKICANGLTIHLVLRLNAVVVSADKDGFLDVIYELNFPRDDPFQIVRVARDQVKMVPPASLSNTTTAASPFSTKSKEKGASSRPTTAGKSLRLLTKVLKEERERERGGASSQ